MMRAYAVLSWAVNAAAAANVVATLASSLGPPLGQPTADAVPGPAPYGQAQSPTANISLVLVRPAPGPGPASSTEAMAAATQGTLPSTSAETGSEDRGIDPGALVGVGTSAALAGGVMLSALVFLLVRWRRGKKKSSGDEEKNSGTTRRWLRISDLEKPRPRPPPLLLPPPTHALGGPDSATATTAVPTFVSNKEDLVADPATRGHWRPMPPSSRPCRAPTRRTSRATPPGFVTGGIGVAMSSRQMVERGDNSVGVGEVARPDAARRAQPWHHEPWSPALPPSLAPSSDRSSYDEFG